MRTGIGLCVSSGVLAVGSVGAAFFSVQDARLATNLAYYTNSDLVARASVLFAQLVVLAAWAGGAPLLLVFGSLCVNEGEYCGPWGEDGGIAMVVFGALLSIVFGVLVYSEYDEQTAAAAQLGDDPFASEQQMPTAEPVGTAVPMTPMTSRHKVMVMTREPTASIVDAVEAEARVGRAACCHSASRRDAYQQHMCLHFVRCGGVVGRIWVAMC